MKDAYDGSHLGTAEVGENPVWYSLPDPVLHVETICKSQQAAARNIYAELTGVDQVWDLYNRGRDVKIGIVDTGADSCHVNNKFRGRVTAKDFTGSRSGWQAVNSHGQHCMGIIDYVLPECQFYVAKGLNDNGQGASRWLANSLIWCADQGCHVISNSWAGGASREIWDAIEYANRKGSICVFAASNTGRTEPQYPASWDNNVSTGAIDYAYNLASFSTRNQSVDFANFGVRVDSTINNCNRAKYSGTSMACPHQAGEVGAHIALEMARGGAKKMGTDARIKHLTRWVRDLGPSGHDRGYGHGKHDIRLAIAEYAVELGQPGPDPQPPVDPVPTELVVGETLTPGRYELVKRARAI